jgi:pimeloyl-ACP methyl ester carboxylesterase
MGLLMKKHVVYLIHGLGHGPWMMQYLAYFLRKKSFETCFFKYDSLSRVFEDNVELLQTCLQNLPFDTIDVVAYSLGGLVLLKALELQTDPRIKRIVLLGSPLRGSRFGERVIGSKIGKFCLWKNAQLWKNMPSLVLPSAEVGLIAGSYRPKFKIFPSIFLEEPNDGIVSVSETQMPGLTDFMIIPVCHLGMLFSRAVGKSVVNFLEKGSFCHPSP